MDLEEGEMGFLFSKKSHRVESTPIIFNPLTAEKPQGSENPELCKEAIVVSSYIFSKHEGISPAVAIAKPGLGLSFQLWSCAIHLCKYLENNSEYLTPEKYGRSIGEKIKIVELGAGTGLAGIVAAKLTPAVEAYITDLPSVIENIKQNIAANDIPFNNAKAAALCWGDPLVPEFYEADLILASDVVYTESLFELLVDALLALCTRKGTIILMSYEKRRKIENRFWKKLHKHFAAKVVETIPEPAARHKRIEIWCITRL